MSQIIPTITAENAHVYREQLERIAPFAERVHVDLMDGVFTPNKSLDYKQVWFPEGITTDVHIMFQEPEAAVRELVKLKPHLLIVPAEASFDFETLRSITADNGVKLGVALLADTPVEATKHIEALDHVLIFSGNLGYQGGSKANLELLNKVDQLKSRNDRLEIGWDGGVNDTNVQALSAGGIDAINVGGHIHFAPDAGLAYKHLKELLAQTV